MSYLSSKGVSLIDLANQYNGRKFGELVLHHVNQDSLRVINQAINRLSQNIHPTLKETTIKFLETIVYAFATNKDFWKTDCSEALNLYTNATKSEAKKYGLEVSDDYAFDIFNLIVLTLASKATQDSDFENFIKKSIKKKWKLNFL